MNEMQKKPGFEMITGGKDETCVTTSDVLKIFKSELVGVEYSNVEKLFSGFDSIKAITFSYDVDFMNYIMTFFKYGEIILGADFIVQKDGKLNDLFEVAANNYEAIQFVKKQKQLVTMLSNGDLSLKAANYVLDHRKMEERELSKHLRTCLEELGMAKISNIMNTMIRLIVMKNMKKILKQHG